MNSPTRALEGPIALKLAYKLCFQESSCQPPLQEERESKLQSSCKKPQGNLQIWFPWPWRIPVGWWESLFTWLRSTFCGGCWTCGHWGWDGAHLEGILVPGQTEGEQAHQCIWPHSGVFSLPKTVKTAKFWECTCTALCVSKFSVWFRNTWKHQMWWLFCVNRLWPNFSPSLRSRTGRLLSFYWDEN